MNEKNLFEKFWKLSIQKFEEKHGPLAEGDESEYGQSTSYEAWKEVVAPKLGHNVAYRQCSNGFSIGYQLKNGEEGDIGPLHSQEFWRRVSIKSQDLVNKALKKKNRGKKQD